VCARRDLLTDESLLPVFKGLLSRTKPFDCVGTADEARLSLWLARGRLKQRGRPVPVVLAALEAELGCADKLLPLLTEWNAEHILPDWWPHADSFPWAEDILADVPPDCRLKPSA